MSSEPPFVVMDYLVVYWTNYHDIMDPFFDWMKSWLDLEEKGQK